MANENKNVDVNFTIEREQIPIDYAVHPERGATPSHSEANRHAKFT
jgi:hypothetical protein